MKSDLTRPKYLLILFMGSGIVLLAVVVFALTVSGEQQSGAANPTNTPFKAIYPTNYPPGKQTLEVGEEQTREAAVLTYPPPPKTPFVVPFTSAPQTLVISLPHRQAGAGTIVENGPSPFPGMTHDMRNLWFEEKDSTRVSVAAGGIRDNPGLSPGASQGFLSVRVTTLDFKDLPGGGAYLTPIKVGPIRIIDAAGERLVLLSDSGVAFYFDLPTRQYVSSLTVIAPTVTTTSSPTPTTPPKPLYP